MTKRRLTFFILWRRKKWKKDSAAGFLAFKPKYGGGLICSMRKGAKKTGNAPLQLQSLGNTYAVHIDNGPGTEFWTPVQSVILDLYKLTEYIFYCKGAIQFLSTSKILTSQGPIPLSARLVCTPRLCCGGRTDSPGGEGDGGGVNILEDERNRIALLQ
jgi:hypothetical protein